MANGKYDATEINLSLYQRILIKIILPHTYYG